MKTFVRNILITGILSIFGSSSMIAQTSNNSSEQWYRAKYGRPSPTEQARLDVSRAAAPQLKPSLAVVSANAGFEQWYRAKYGRPSPTEEARLQITVAEIAALKATQPTVAAVARRGAEPREQAIAQTPTLGKEELQALIATAKTPSQHQAIAKDYRDQAQGFLAQAKEHEAMVAAYKASPNMTSKNQAATIGHCEYFVGKFNDLAVKSQELAQLHERMAADAGKN